VLLDGPGRCEKHRSGFAWRGPQLEGYGSSRWTRLSLKIRRERPICERCRSRPSTQVHHRRHLRFPNPRWYDPRELEALCDECHRAETGRHGALRRQGRA